MAKKNNLQRRRVRHQWILREAVKEEEAKKLKDLKRSEAKQTTSLQASDNNSHDKSNEWDGDVKDVTMRISSIKRNKTRRGIQTRVRECVG